jgi:hypothetical protein
METNTPVIAIDGVPTSRHVATSIAHIVDIALDRTQLFDVFKIKSIICKSNRHQFPHIDTNTLLIAVECSDLMSHITDLYLLMEMVYKQAQALGIMDLTVRLSDHIASNYSFDVKVV